MPNISAIKCGDPGYPLNGYREGTDFSLNKKVSYRCETGFRLVGSEDRQCLPSGHWTGHEPTCEGNHVYQILFKFPPKTLFSGTC